MFEITNAFSQLATQNEIMIYSRTHKHSDLTTTTRDSFKFYEEDDQPWYLDQDSLKAEI